MQIHWLRLEVEDLGPDPGEDTFWQQQKPRPHAQYSTRYADLTCPALEDTAQRGVRQGLGIHGYNHGRGDSLLLELLPFYESMFPMAGA